ncbi:hypothetical protein NDN08_007208 [Rhodosorus marinus]|uniref:Uncharacterized protein n=1 Tax=Rhodosorus marinus TaxID=101924 RepID=A0AAV8UJB0_9RHOD|nr:hypothetical protein NDN08_007208 [Rhodosorus marinus]
MESCQLLMDSSIPLDISFFEDGILGYHHRMGTFEVLCTISGATKSWLLFENETGLEWSARPYEQRSQVLSFSRLQGSPGPELLEKLLCLYLVRISADEQNLIGSGYALSEDGVAAFPMRHVVPGR